MEEARQEYEKSLKIYCKLAQKDPASYLLYVAITRNNLGNLDSAQNRMEEAGKESRNPGLPRYKIRISPPSNFSPAHAATSCTIGTRACTSLREASGI